MSEDIRWEHRFENFEKAFLLLQEATQRDFSSLSDLEKEGLVQRFEYTFVLAWKTLKDYLDFSGIVFDQVTPRNVIKQAFAAGIIADGQLWIDMLKDRNLMSHTYDEEIFLQAAERIATRYVIAVQLLYLFLKKEIGE